jgi:hypothetical protein
VGARARGCAQCGAAYPRAVLVSFREPERQQDRGSFVSAFHRRWNLHNLAADGEANE